MDAAPQIAPQPSATPAQMQDVMAHPQRAALLRLLVQPAHWVHPLHQQRLLGLPEPPDWGGSAGDNASAAARSGAIWQRQAHAALLARLQLPLALDLQEQALALALLQAPQWQQLPLAAGAALAAPRLRRVIARDQVLALQGALGAAVLQRACQGAAEPHPQPGAHSGPKSKLQSELQSDPQRPYSASALSALLALPLGALAPACRALGEALLARALAAVSPALARYLQLRLPPSASAQTPQPGSPADSPADPVASLVPSIVHAYTPAQALRRSLAALTHL